MQASDTTILTFDEVRVPADHVIGEEGMGFTYQMLQFQVEGSLLATLLQEERLAAAAGCLVPLATVLEETIAYTRCSTSPSPSTPGSARPSARRSWTTSTSTSAWRSSTPRWSW